ncbi:MAG: Bax inhibitor-1/YccA family protein [Candidatus Obscuribacterales bacterium]|nr:Bax inhibitor-1/YccA family protein [Candidatus Obscuribacterales bacterium]
MAFKTGNPALNKDTFAEVQTGGLVAGDNVMTLDGTAVKTAFLLLLLITSAAVTWKLYFAGNLVLVTSLFWVGVIGGFLVAMICVFNKKDAPFLAPVYAILEGLALGGISGIYQGEYQGIVMQAIGITVAVLVALLFAYTTHLVRVTENFKLGVIAATGGIALVYLVDLVGMFSHLWRVPFINMNDTSPVGILVCVGIAIVAALNLVLDFDFIEQGVNAKAPKYMEWYGAFGLLVTLVWLYLEILRILAKLRKR